jgi:hypothetical protein
LQGDLVGNRAVQRDPHVYARISETLFVKLDCVSTGVQDQLAGDIAEQSDVVTVDEYLGIDTGVQAEEQAAGRLVRWRW